MGRLANWRRRRKLVARLGEGDGNAAADAFETHEQSQARIDREFAKHGQSAALIEYLVAPRELGVKRGAEVIDGAGGRDDFDVVRVAIGQWAGAGAILDLLCWFKEAADEGIATEAMEEFLAISTNSGRPEALEAGVAVASAAFLSNISADDTSEARALVRGFSPAPVAHEQEEEAWEAASRHPEEANPILVQLLYDAAVEDAYELEAHDLQEWIRYWQYSSGAADNVYREHMDKYFPDLAPHDVVTFSRPLLE